MKAHTAHRWRVLSVCVNCGAPLLFGCAFAGRFRNSPDERSRPYRCIATETDQQRAKRKYAHDCTKRTIRRKRPNLYREAVRIFADDIAEVLPL